MENVVLSVHLILALLLIGVVLLQRSEGGGLGMGGSGTGVMTGRQAANALTKLTWALAAGFIVTSLTLTALAAHKAGGSSILDRILQEQPAAQSTGVPNVELPPPSADAPATPPAADAPVTPPAAN
jgi:preprotein translocase subunit SecG